MKQPDLVYETHTMRFPFAQIFFGRTFQILCEVLFEYAETEDGNFRIKVKSLTGTFEDGTVYDLMYLTEDEDSMYANYILVCIYANKEHWNFNPNEGELEWWEVNRIPPR